MKKVLFPILFIFLFSCNSNNEKLEKEIAELKAKNIKLEESLNNRKTKEIVDLQVLLNTKDKIKLDRENKVSGQFIRYENLPEYKLYIMDSISNQKILVADNLNGPSFEFNFKPKSAKENSLLLIVEMKIAEKKIEMFGRLDYAVEK